MFNPSKVAFARLQSGKTNFLDRGSKSRILFKGMRVIFFFLSRLDKIKYNFVSNL